MRLVCVWHTIGQTSAGNLKSKVKPARTAAPDDRCANFSASTCPTPLPLLTTRSTADKLPLEKFHRLLDLGFWVKFLKLNSISLFVFFGEFYRVSLDPVILCGACGAPMAWPGGGAKLSCSPGPRSSIAKSILIF